MDKEVLSENGCGKLHFLGLKLGSAFQAFNPEGGQTWEVLLEARFRAKTFKNEAKSEGRV